MISVADAGMAIAEVEAPPSKTPPIVRVTGLTKRFPVRRGWRELLAAPFRPVTFATVVDNVSFSIAPGEFFGLLGANGAGKTTLFRMLAAQILPDGGSALIDGWDVVRHPRQVQARLTPVGTDERSLNWRLNARQNLELFAVLYGVERSAVKRRVDELLEVVGLHDAGTKLVGMFSSGMKQRLLIARALLARPSVLLLDEPTRSLDPIAARQLRAFLRDEIVGRHGCTVVLATHSAEEAFELCDRVGVLERGRMVAIGRVQELMREVSDDVFEVEVRETQLPEARRVLHACGCEVAAVDRDPPPGWRALRVEVAGGPDRAAKLLSRMSLAGVDIVRFQRVELTLAEMIERIVERRAGGHRA